MKAFFAEVWHDLREKRLWPVAALLAVALLAVPVVLSEKRQTPPPAPNPAASAKKPQVPVVEPVADEQVSFSSLRAFRAKDPFKPEGRKLKNLTQLASESGRPAPGGVGSSGSSTGEPSPGASSASGSSPSVPGGSGGSGGGGGPLGGGGEGGGRSPSPGIRRATFVYVADVRFGRPGSERRYRGLQRLRMLPSADSPLLVFLGATRTGGNAVFLVDANLRQAGEGSCADSACSVLSIGPGSEHRFRDARDREYVLVIDAIRQVEVGGRGSSAKESAAAKRGRASSAKAPRPTRRERDERGRGLVSALLVDTETVMTGAPSWAERRSR